LKIHLPTSRYAAVKAAAIVYILVSVSQALASNIPISDPSFETPGVSAGSFTFITGTGWTATGGAPVIDYPLTNQFVSVPDGNQVAILDDFNTTGTLSQTLTTDLAANTSYTLTFFVGNDLLLPYTGYTAELTANGVTLASDNSAVSPTAGNFLQDTIQFTSSSNPAELGQPLGITFSDVGFNSVAFDDVQLTATSAGNSTPEPGTWITFAAGLVLLAPLRRRLASRPRRA
jgi:hypothetical protein